MAEYVNATTSGGIPNWMIYLPIIYAMHSLLSIVLNVASVLLLYNDRTLFQDSTRIFYIGLSVSDLLTGVLTTVKTTLLLMGFLGNATACAVLESLNYLMFAQSLFILQLITFDKYIQIKAPLHYTRWVTEPRAKLLLLACLLLPILLLILGSLPYSFIDSLGSYCRSRSTFENNNIFFVMAGVLLAFLATSAFVNVQLVAITYRQNRRIAAMATLSDQQVRAQRRIAVRGTVTILLFNIVSHTAWSLWIVQIFLELGLGINVQYTKTPLLTHIWLMTTWCNPVILLIANRAFRQSMRKLIRQGNSRNFGEFLNFDAFGMIHKSCHLSYKRF